MVLLRGLCHGYFLPCSPHFAHCYRIGIVTLLTTVERYGVQLDVPQDVLADLVGVEELKKIRFAGLPKFNEAELRERAKSVRLELKQSREGIALYTVSALKACLKKLGLPVSGKKNELVDRLVSLPSFRASMLEEANAELFEADKKDK